MYEPEDHECDDANGSAEGAAVFPLIPEDLQVHPLLLAVLHAMVFIDGSTDEIVCPDGAAEAMEYIATYLQRLRGPILATVREDLQCLLDFAKQQGWPKQQQAFLKSFLTDNGIGPHGA